ncbi:MAG: ribonuclease Z [Flavobacteriales bacterium]
MSFKLTILGCNSALPTVDKNPTSQLLSANERFFLIDCAEGTQVQLRRYKIKFQRINHIFISHLHGDHYFGLIGLISSMHLLGREKELHLYAHPPLKEIIDSQLAASNTELCYPLFFHPLPYENERILFEDNKIEVSNILLDHGIPCSGFLFKEKLSLRKINSEKINEYNVPIDQFKSLKNGEDFITIEGEKISNEILTTENRLPISYAFCSDTKYNDRIVEKIKNVSLLYHETTFMEDRKERAIETFHSTTIDAATIAVKSEVGALLIGHFSQRYKELDELLSETKSVFDNTKLAQQGMQIDFSDL